MPVLSTVFLWLPLHPEFSERYTKAQEQRAQHLFDALLEIADTPQEGVTFVDKGIAVVEVRKANANEWLPWAAENEVHPALMAWVDQTPTVLSSFRDDDFDIDNPYVYNPKRVQGKFITPRSLELGSNVIWAKDKISQNALTCALVGTIGSAGANDIASFLAYQDEIPTRESIINTPDTAAIPTSAGAIITLLFNLERAVDGDTLAPIMKYVTRLDAEKQAVFCTALARSKSKQTIAFRNKAFTDWARENQDIL
jgi:hypothetical protein